MSSATVLKDPTIALASAFVAGVIGSVVLAGTLVVDPGRFIEGAELVEPQAETTKAMTTQTAAAAIPSIRIMVLLRLAASLSAVGEVPVSLNRLSALATEVAGG